MDPREFTDRLSALRAEYERDFAERSDTTSTDPLKYHLYHLALYWRRLLGFCRNFASSEGASVHTNFGVCIQMGSEFATKLIGPSSPIFELWQDYWWRTCAMLHKPAITLEEAEAASRAFDACLARLGYNPWAK